MPARVSTQLVEVYLLVEQPRQRLSHWSQALAPLDDAAAPPLARVDAHYDPSASQAIFALAYEEQSLGTRLNYVVEVALLAEIGMVQPAELSEGDRRRFVTDRLAACTVRVSEQPKVVAALVELVRRVRGQKLSPAPSALQATLLPRGRATVAPSVRARETADPMLVVAKGTRTHSPGEAPRGTRERAAVELVPRGTGEIALGPLRGGDTGADAMLAEATPAVAGEPAAIAAEIWTSEDSESQTHPAAAAAYRRGEDGLRPSPNIVTRGGVHRANTVTMSTTETRRMMEALVKRGEAEPIGDPPPAEPAGPADRAESGAPVEAVEGPEPTDAVETAVTAPRMISARYLRSGRWVPLRVGSLSLKGAALMAVALPRIDDRVEVALAYAQHRALVRGAVHKVSTMKETEASGATMFAVNFELDDNSRQQLTALLTAARAANVTIKPAPPRSTRRYPVEWPVCLGTTRGAVRAEALDVSADGMFVKPVHALSLDAHVTFTAVLDDSLPPVSGHARVVRHITDTDARASGLSSGYGLNILDMAESERERWSAFLSRVARRASKRILIAASAARYAELEAGLVAGGYATTGGTEPAAIAQLVGADARPVDAALIDAAWLVSEGSTLWVESVFTARKVPYVTVHGDAKRARGAVDRLLAVV